MQQFLIPTVMLFFPTRMFASLFVVIVGVCYCSKDINEVFLGRPQLSGPSVALLDGIEQFKCELPTHPKNESVLFQLFKRNGRDKWLGDSLVGETGTFHLVIKETHDSNLVCVAKLENNNITEPSFSNLHRLKVIVPVKDANVIVRSGAMEFFEGTTLELVCNLSNGTYASYEWQLNGERISPSPSHNFSDDILSIYRTTSKDSGFYMCVATNKFNNTVYNSTSPEVVIRVKDVVSSPEISFTVSKDGFDFSAKVTCQSRRGTPPITFSLYNDNHLFANVTSETSDAKFNVPLVLDQYMGWLQCQAKNGNWTAHSQKLPLEVVRVARPVKLHYDYDFGENYAVVALRIYCRVAKGSHPTYEWFFNNSPLHGQGSFYYIVDQSPEQSILMLSVGRSSAGNYSCKVSDSFDNTQTISSVEKYFDKEVVNRLPVLGVAVVFGCFIFLILLVSVCCWIGVVFRRRQFGEISLLGLETGNRGAAYEGELDLLKYNEDDDLVKTVSGDEFDQASAVSLDEWPQIIEEKTTLEDSLVEFL